MSPRSSSGLLKVVDDNVLTMTSNQRNHSIPSPFQSCHAKTRIDVWIFHKFVYIFTLLNTFYTYLYLRGGEKGKTILSLELQLSIGGNENLP